MPGNLVPFVPDKNGVRQKRHVRRRYDAAGRLVFASNGVLTRTLSHDSLDRVVFEERRFPGTTRQAFTLSRQWDGEGRFHQLTYPDGTASAEAGTSRRFGDFLVGRAAA